MAKKDGQIVFGEFKWVVTVKVKYLVSRKVVFELDLGVEEVDPRF